MDTSTNPDDRFLPPLISQDTLGICYASAAATLINFQQCKSKNIECKSQTDAELVSQLGIARYATDPIPGTLEEYDDSYTKLKEGGSSVTILNRVTSGMYRLPSEKCVSLARILSKEIIKSEGATKAQLALWKDFKIQYLAYQKAKKEGCEECASNAYSTALNSVTKNLNLEEEPANTEQASQTKLLSALSKDTYEEALNSLLYPPKCSEDKNGIEFDKDAHKETFQFPNNEKATLNQKIDKIVSILQSKDPVVLEGICVADCKTKQPKLHAVVIAGYRKKCQKNSCKYAFRIINSAGKRWQELNNDGWVEADNLLKSSPQGQINWIGPRKPRVIDFGQ